MRAAILILALTAAGCLGAPTIDAEDCAAEANACGECDDDNPWCEDGFVCQYGAVACPDEPPPGNEPGRWIPACAPLSYSCDRGSLMWTVGSLPLCTRPEAPPLCADGTDGFCVFVPYWPRGSLSGTC